MGRMLIYAGAAVATGIILYLGLTGKAEYITRFFTKKTEAAA